MEGEKIRGTIDKRFSFTKEIKIVFHIGMYWNSRVKTFWINIMGKELQISQKENGKWGILYIK